MLHERAYRETSLLLEVLTRDQGRLGVVVRGVRAAKPRFSRGGLRPFQCLSMDLRLAGELAQLTAIETLGQALVLGAGLLQSGLYVNELLTRMTERHDPHPEIFQRYAQLLTEFTSEEPLAWTLRRFERDLLALLGYGLLLTETFDSAQAIDPESIYLYVPEQGPQRRSGLQSGATVKGSALLALDADVRPDEADLGSLRLLMRKVIQHHLGGRQLDAWRVLAPLRPPTS